VATTAGRGRARHPSAVLARRLVLALVVTLGVAFAVEGGEYGTRDLLSRRAKREALEADVARLRGVVDSLAAAVRAVQEDPATIERIAREEYGMVRGDRELLYRFAEDAAER
jgi:cell division protein FtsB